jgi:phenylpropionate dioxygenase-like ring-hydroxylating dioxygenase large terminal subunit
MATVDNGRREWGAEFTARLDELKKPGLQAATLPPEAYWSPELYELELQRIFFKEWVCVGRVEDVPAPGDFITHQIATESLIIVRDHENQICVHHNVCRHRGCQLVEGAGNTPAFKCPYHGWMYGLGGDLRGAPEFRHTENFDKKDYPLISAQVEIWEGFIMVNLDPEAEPFAPRVSEMSRFGLEKYGMGDHVTIHKWEFRLNCNWKEWMENSIEEYHIPWVHTETFQAVSPMKGWVEFPDISEQPWIAMVGQFPGFSYSDTGDPLFPVTPETADLAPEYSGMPIWVAYPSMGVLNSVDTTVYYVLLPDGPDHCYLRLGLAVAKESAEALARGDDPILQASREEYVRNIDSFLAEDNMISEQQHRGMRSRHAKAGRFSKHELLAWKFDKWVAERAYW